MMKSVMKKVMKKVVKGAAVKITKKVVKEVVKKGNVLKKPANDFPTYVKVKGKDYKLPKGWDVKEAQKVNYRELKVDNLDKIFLPVTQIEQFYQEAPEVYATDTVGLHLKAYNRYDNCDLEWMQDLDLITPLKYYSNPLLFLRGVLRRAFPI